MIQLDKNSWEAAVARFEESNFVNSWAYGESQAVSGAEVFRLLLPAGACIQAVLRDARRGRYLEIGGGPLLDYQDHQLARQTFDAIRQLARDNNCVYVRVRPQLEDLPQNRLLLAKLGLRLAPMHLMAEHTSIINLKDRSEDQLLAAMRRQTRYLVRQADKQGVEVAIDNSMEAQQAFYDLQLQTAERQGFVLAPRQQLLAESKCLINAGHGRLYHAQANGVLLAVALVIFYGQEADYWQGASTAEGRNIPGAYAMQWQAIRDAREAGCVRYNFWGTAPADQPKHRFAGVTVFKQGFGGDSYQYVPAHDLVINRVAYTKNWLIETVRKKKRRL